MTFTLRFGWAICACVAVAQLGLTTPGFSQSAVSLGTIEGTVRDATGAVLPGSTLTFRNADTGFSRTITSEANGKFRAPLLPLGKYAITVEMPGFKTLNREGVVLTIGSTVTLDDLRLEVATVQETITVTAESPVVETTRAVVATTFEERAIQTLPINGRDFQDFAELTPTVVKERARDTISMGGQKGIDTNVTLDGADFNNSFFGQATGQPEAKQFVISQEAVQEFQVLSNGYSAEFGRSGGGVLNVVTKSGTNDVRGSGFFFGRSSELVSRLQDANGNDLPKAGFEGQQFGGSVGGPIRKDKAHYFASVDQQFFTTPFTVRFNRDVSAVPPISSIYGKPISGVDNLSSLQGDFQREINLTAFLGKVDYQLNRNNTLSIRYNYSRARLINFGPSAGGVEGLIQSVEAGQNENSMDTSHSFAVSNTTVLGNNKFNEVRFQYAYESRPRNAETNEIPEVQISGCCEWGREGFLPITSEHPRFQITENFTYLFGNHDLKTGVDFNFTSTSQGFFGDSGGVYNFASLEDFLAQRPRTFRQRVGLNGFTTVESGTIDFRQQEYGFYVQDVWKPRAGLTLNAGLRWEGLNNPTVPTQEFGKQASNPANPGSVFGLDQTSVNDDYNNWSPRFGFAWDPKNDGKTVIRGGGGIFYSRVPLLLIAEVLTSNGYRQALISLNYPDPLAPTFPFIFPETGVPQGSPLNARVPAADISFYEPNFQSPQIQRTNIGFEKEIRPNFSVGVDYVYAHTIHGQRRRDLNLDPPIGVDAAGRGLFVSATAARPDPRYRRFVLLESSANTRYDAFILSAKKRYSEKLQFQTYYTYSRTLSSDDNERSTSFRISQPEKPEADWGRSERDVPHRFVASAVYDLPYSINLGAVLVMSSGNPFNVTVGNDANGDGQLTDRAIVNATNQARVDGAGQDLPGGLQPRNSARQPSFYNVDLRVTKLFDFGRPGRLELMLEVFNLLNSANRTTSLGRLDLTNFGVLNQVGASRQAQLGVRYRW